MTGEDEHRLKARRLGLDTHSEMMVFMRRNSPVCRSEGFSSHNRVALAAGPSSVIATLYQVDSDFLAPDEAGLSETTWRHLGVNQGDLVAVRHAPQVESLEGSEEPNFWPFPGQLWAKRHHHGQWQHLFGNRDFLVHYGLHIGAAFRPRVSANSPGPWWMSATASSGTPQLSRTSTP